MLNATTRPVMTVWAKCKGAGLIFILTVCIGLWIVEVSFRKIAKEAWCYNRCKGWTEKGGHTTRYTQTQGTTLNKQQKDRNNVCDER